MKNLNTVRVVIRKEGKTSAELVNDYLKRGGLVTKVKAHKPSIKRSLKGAKNKNFVYDHEMSTGCRKGSVI